MVQNGDIVMENAFVPDKDRLPGINSFADTNKVFHSYVDVKFKCVMMIVIVN